MTPTHQQAGPPAATDSRPEHNAAAEPAAVPVESFHEKPAGRGESFDALVEEIRQRYGSNADQLFPHLEDVIRRRLGFASQEPAAAGLAALTGSTVRLIAALVPTAVLGQWAQIPWGRWATILVFYAGFDAMRYYENSSVSWTRSVVEDWTALLPTIARESDLKDLADFTRRWYRLPVVTAVGAAVAAIMLLTCWLIAPSAMTELPAGTIVLLAFLLYDFGATPIYWGVLLNWALTGREARYDHHLFWSSPADSPEVQRVMRKTVVQGSLAGIWITYFLLLTLVLVSWSSPAVVPLAVGFIVIGYLSTIGAAIGNRASIRRIIERVRLQRLKGLQHRIDVFESRYTELSPQESQQLRDLLDLHDRIRDAPATPTTAHTLVHAGAGLIVPTIAFIITVFGEVSAERILDAILP